MPFPSLRASITSYKINSIRRLPTVLLTISKEVIIGTPLLSNVESVRVNLLIATFINKEPNTGRDKSLLSNHNRPFLVATNLLKIKLKIENPTIKNKILRLTTLLTIIRSAVGPGNFASSVVKISANCGITKVNMKRVIPIAIIVTTIGYTKAALTFFCKLADFSK